MGNKKIPTHKVCTICNIDKALEEFNKRKIGKYGRASQCKDCDKKRSKKFYEDNPEYNKRQCKKWQEEDKRKRESDSEYNKERLKVDEQNRERSKQWNKDNPERKAISDKRHRDNNPEYLKNWHEEHPDKSKEYAITYREKHPEVLAMYYKRYKESNAGKLVIENWRRSNAGMESRSKSQAKRDRELNYTPLNKRFNGSNGHHINTEYVIHMPEYIHTSFKHCVQGKYAGLKIKEMNSLAFEYLFENLDSITVSEEFAFKLMLENT